MRVVRFYVICCFRPFFSSFPLLLSSSPFLSSPPLLSSSPFPPFLSSFPLLLSSPPFLSSSPPLLFSSPPPPAQSRPSTHSILCRIFTTTIYASVPCRTLTTTIPAQCSLPDHNHDYLCPVFPAGPQPRLSTPSISCRTSCRKIWDKECIEEN